MLKKGNKQLQIIFLNFILITKAILLLYPKATISVKIYTNSIFNVTSIFSVRQILVIVVVTIQAPKEVIQQ